MMQWFIMVLYGIAAALFAYCVSLAVSSPLAAFATVAAYQFVIFIVSFSGPNYSRYNWLTIGKLYLSAYMLVLTYGPVTEANSMIATIHWATAWVSPVNSVVSLPPSVAYRAALISPFRRLALPLYRPMSSRFCATVMNQSPPPLWAPLPDSAGPSFISLSPSCCSLPSSSGPTLARARLVGSRTFVNSRRRRAVLQTARSTFSLPRKRQIDRTTF